MEIRGAVHGITVYDDFAHHPTAIATTVEGLRAKIGKSRILAVLEPRSNTMKLGVMKAQLPGSLTEADQVRPGLLLRRQPRLGPRRGFGPTGRQGMRVRQPRQAGCATGGRRAAGGSRADDEQRGIRGDTREAAGCAASSLS